MPWSGWVSRLDWPRRDSDPVSAAMKVTGPVRPVRHYGSVDVFLEALYMAAPGEVMMIDNGGRDDEGCIGDLTVLEVAAAGWPGWWFGGVTATIAN